MNKKKLEELIRLVEDSEIGELTLSGPVNTIRIVKIPSRAAVHNHDAVTAAARPQATPAVPAVEVAVAEAPAPADDTPDRDSGLVPVVSPMVGTFYASASPESAPYVRQGDHVNKGQIVCIVEAMKLMNEIETEVSGTIVRIAVENAQPVEFGQTLFLIEPA